METGEVEELSIAIDKFLTVIQADPFAVLELSPLLQFYNEGGMLHPGQLINVYPPFCTKESSDGVLLSAVPAQQRLRFLIEFSQQLANQREDGAFMIDIQD
jgi:hypothetical protein